MMKTSSHRNRKHQPAQHERVESAPASPSSPKGGSLLGHLGSNFLRRGGSKNNLTALEASPVHPPSPEAGARQKRGAALQPSPASSTASSISSSSSSSVTSDGSRRRPKSKSSSASAQRKMVRDDNNSSSSSLSLGDQLQQLALNSSPNPKPGKSASISNRSFLSLDDEMSESELELDNERDVSAEEHLNTSIAALQQFNYDSPRSSVRSARYRKVDVHELGLVELNDSYLSDSDTSTQRKKKKKEAKKKKTEKKDKKIKSSDGSNNKLSSLASPSKARSTSHASPSSVIAATGRKKIAIGESRTSSQDISSGNITHSPSSPRGRSPLRSPGSSISPHKRGVAPLSNHRPARRLSHMYGKPYIPKIVNTMKQDMMRIDQLTAQIKAVKERTRTELAVIEEKRSKAMQKLKSEYAAESRDISDLALPKPADLESNQRLADQLRRENAQIREHNQQMRTNCQNIRINNVRLEEKTVELTDYKTRLDAHHKRVSEEHDKLKAMHDQYEKEVKELEEEVEQETEKARYEHLNRARFERRAYEFAELIRLHDKDNKDLHRRIEAILNVADSEKHLFPPSAVDRNEMKRQAASSRRASMREAL